MLKRVIRMCDALSCPLIVMVLLTQALACQGLVSEALAQSDDATVAEAVASDTDVAAMRTRFLDAASNFAFLGGAQKDQTFELLPDPILNWSNPERRTSAGGMFLWTLHGRPMVAMCGYPTGEAGFDGSVVYDCEFQSLASEPLTATESGVLVWEPNQAGVVFQTLKSDSDPATSSAARMLQMRSLSREFTGKLVPPQRTEIPLRMLSSPIYRYPEPSHSSDYVDGAIFAMVQGTDPEVLLQIEAVMNDQGEAKWRYALSRMSMVPTEVRHRDALIWETEWAIKNRNTPYFVIKR